MRKRVVGWAAALAALMAAGPARAERPTDLWTTVTKTATATSAQTDATLWDPDAGKRVALQGCFISADRATVVELEVSDVDVVPPVYLETLGHVTIGGDGTLLYVGAEDAVLTYTTSLGTAPPIAPIHGRVSVLCWGYELE